jgi:hypothetical protein
VSNFVEFFGRKPVMVWHDQLLGETLATFRREHAHLAMVQDVFVEGDNDPIYVVVGIITLEDIIEEILGTEIEDEFDNENSALNTTLRDMDLARFKALNSKVTDDKLSVDEIEAIVTFLPNSVPTLVDYLGKIGSSTVRDLVLDGQVFVLNKQTPEGVFKPHANDVIVRKGKFTNTCILILQGKVRLIYDKAEVEMIPKIAEDMNLEKKEDTPPPAAFNMEGTPHHELIVEREEILGPWSIICGDALVSEIGDYAPRFTACVYTENVRFVRITNICSTVAPVKHPRRGELRRGNSTKNSSNHDPTRKSATEFKI